ncbi:MAG: GNAT family N-acetyltransferase [Alphaproteobacteria bacterium]|nr:GNAT family N-acetyltransferase [Alphaproteobacteria bacterium]
MSAPPKTLLHATPEEEAAIRAAVRASANMASPTGERRLARTEDAAAAAAFFADDAASGPIYDLPRPFTQANVRAWIEGRLERHAAGEAVLTFVYDGDEIVSYADVAIWPQHASGELAGAVRADRQNSGQGSANMRDMFDWMFEDLGLRLICLTAALDNIRSQRGIDAAGFTRMGGRDVVRADGSIRQSVYWEMTRDQWRARWKSAS